MAAAATIPLGSLDVALLVISLLVNALIGLYFTNKNKSISAYMLGDQKLGVLPVAISLMTSCLSGLTLLGSSSELYYQGSTYAFVVVPMLLCGPLTAYTMLPVFYRMNELSLYKYLQKRFGHTIKYIVTVVFMVQMLFYNSVVLYMPSMALEAIFGVSRFYSILIIGALCIVYSSIGGIKAVVWTDFFQAALMYAAVMFVCLLGTYNAGGFAQVFALAQQSNRFNLDGFLNLDLTTRHTLFGIIFGSTLKHIYLVGINQVQIQRAFSLPTLRQAQHAYLLCSLFGASIIILSSYMGAVVLAAYRSCDPYLAGEIPRRDAIVVHYVARYLSAIPGFRGVFVAGIASATLSTLSSFSNSMAALALEDFIKPAAKALRKNEPSDKTKTLLAKLLATLFGALCVALAYIVEKFNSRLLQATTTMFGAIGVPFVIAFALGTFTRVANTCGILAGFAATLSLGAYVTIYQTFFEAPLKPIMPVYFGDKCAAVFNMTLPSDELPSLESLIQTNKWQPQQQVDASGHFHLSQISYMMLPFVQTIVMVIVALVVSLLTGGCKQQVDELHLAKFVRNKCDPKHKGGNTFTKPTNANQNVEAKNLERNLASLPQELSDGNWKKNTLDD